MLNSCCASSVYTEERAKKISESRTGYKDTSSARENKSMAAKKRSNVHLLEAAAKRKGKSWKIINGKRTWYDKELSK